MKHEEDYNYSAESVFDTFPWPQSPTVAQTNTVAQCGREIQRIRAGTKAKGGLRGLYYTLGLPGKNLLKDAYAALDASVLAAYGFSQKVDLLEQLLRLNGEVSKAIIARTAAAPPGIPKGYLKPESLVTKDCLGAEKPQ